MRMVACGAGSGTMQYLQSSSIPASMSSWTPRLQYSSSLVPLTIRSPPSSAPDSNMASIAARAHAAPPFMSWAPSP